MSNVFLITGNAGQGKTTTAANLARALRLNGHDVLVVDGDTKTPKLCYHFKILPQKTTQDIIIGNAKAKDAIYLHPGGLKMMFSSLTPTKTAHPSIILHELKKLANVVIIDVPTYDKTWYETNEPAIIVTQPDFPSIMEAHKLRKQIPNSHGVIVNRVHNDQFELSPGNIRQLTNFTILGLIQEEKYMREALKHGYTLVESHPELETSTIFRQVAAKLMNQEYKSPIKKTNLFEKLASL